MNAQFNKVVFENSQQNDGEESSQLQNFQEIVEEDDKMDRYLERQITGQTENIY